MQVAECERCFYAVIRRAKVGKFIEIREAVAEYFGSVR